MIEITHLRKTHGRRTVVDDVSLRARPGRVTAFLGPNGAGKSSTLRILLGLDTATAGQALIGGARYRSLRRPLTVVGALLDGPGAHPARTARAHLRWMARSNGIALARVDEVLAEVGLAEAARRRIGGFSLGMGQRLGVASALLGDPAVLVLDEPTNGLDPEGIRWMRTVLRGCAAQGRTVLVSSHLMTEMEDVADDVIVLAQGRVLADGTVDEVRGSHRHLEEAFFALTDAAARRNTP